MGRAASFVDQLKYCEVALPQTKAACIAGPLIARLRPDCDEGLIGIESNSKPPYATHNTKIVNGGASSLFDGLVRSPLQDSHRRGWCVRGGMNTDGYRD